jgi:putative membrane protein
VNQAVFAFVRYSLREKPIAPALTNLHLNRSSGEVRWCSIPRPYFSPQEKWMIRVPGKFFALPIAAIVFSTATFAFAAATATPADLDFVAHVSQGGSYEVAAGKVAEMRGQTPDIRDLGVMEAHDHTLVNDKLKQIAGETGAPFPEHLNAEFQQRLDKLKAVPAAKFDAYFLADMKQIHDGDEKRFQNESKGGSKPYQKFAYQTAVVVQRHLGAINATGAM